MKNLTAINDEVIDLKSKKILCPLVIHRFVSQIGLYIYKWLIWVVIVIQISCEDDFSQ
jgi:hypothetical protein